MFYLRLIVTAMRSLETNFLRSLLATLGVLIGVGAVVSAMSILEGFSNDFARRFKSMGSNVLWVMPSEVRIQGRSMGVAQTLDLKDVVTLSREMGEEVENIAPEAFASAIIKRFQKSKEYTVVATSNAYFEINDYKAESGRTLTPAESLDENACVVCLGHKVAEDLFGGGDPAGQLVKIRNVSFRVAGVMEKKGNMGFLNADETVYIPIQTGLKRFLNRKWLNRLTISIKDVKQLEAAQNKVKRVLRVAHDIRPGEPDDVNTFTQEEATQNVNQVMFIWKAVFYSISGISLVVGAIGIMNIMLVSVTERTREIGLRQALGARPADVLTQFLLEAIILSLAGGIAGIIVGVGGSYLFGTFGAMRTEIVPLSIPLAFGAAAIVGIFFGYYPATRAAKLDPIEALRRE